MKNKILKKLREILYREVPFSQKMKEKRIYFDMPDEEWDLDTFTQQKKSFMQNFYEVHYIDIQLDIYKQLEKLEREWKISNEPKGMKEMPESILKMIISALTHESVLLNFDNNVSDKSLIRLMTVCQDCDNNFRKLRVGFLAELEG